MKKGSLKYIFSFIAFLLIGGSLSLILGQDANWDLLNYHLYNPYAFLSGRVGSDFLAAGIQSYFSPFLDIPFYLLISHFNNYPHAVVFIQGIYFGILCFLIFILSLEFFLKTINFTPSSRLFLSALSTIIGGGGFATFSEIGTTFNDIQTGCLVIFAIYLYIKHGICQNTCNIEMAVGLLLGIACGLKLTSAIYAVSFLMGIAIFHRHDKFFKKSFYYAIFLGIGFVVSYGYWGCVLYSLYGNPFFPFFNNIFKSKFFPTISFVDARFFPKTFLQSICYPFFWSGAHGLSSTVAELKFTDPRFFIVYLIVIVLFLKFLLKYFSKVRQPVEKADPFDFILLVWIFSYIIFQVKFSIIRYAIPLENLSGLIIIYTLVRFLKDKQHLAIYLSIVITVSIIILTKIPSWGRLPIGNVFYSISKINIPDDAIFSTLTPPCAFIVTGLGLKNKVINFNYLDKNELKYSEVVILANIGTSDVGTKTTLSKYKIDFNKHCQKIENSLSGNIFVCFHHPYSEE